MSDWLEVRHGASPLILSMPHTGTQIPDVIGEGLVSLWLARKDADWWVDRLYDFAHELGATTIRTRLSRTVIDVNRDPSGASLYPGQVTTELCPATTFDGEPLYKPGRAPRPREIEDRKARWFAPYHAAIGEAIARVKACHSRIVLYDAHSIRSRVPRLFEGELAHFNIGTNSGASCDGALTAAVERACSARDFTRVTDGRFKGGWTTRHYGKPLEGIHAIQMELACRGYMNEPSQVDETNWPGAYDEGRALQMRTLLRGVLEAALRFAEKGVA